MWLTPSSTARRSTATASSRSRGGPLTPGPGSCMAPKPTWGTGRPANGKLWDVEAVMVPTLARWWLSYVVVVGRPWTGSGAERFPDGLGLQEGGQPLEPRIVGPVQLIPARPEHPFEVVGRGHLQLGGVLGVTRCAGEVDGVDVHV